MDNQTPSLHPVVTDDTLTKQVKSACGWIYIIAALSLVNTVLALAGSDRQFVAGFAITQIVDQIGTFIGGPGKIIAGVFDIIIAACMLGLGFMASKAKSWAFITTLVLYGIDTLLIAGIVIFSPVGRNGLLSLVIHGLAIYFIIVGMTASFKIARMQSQPAAPVSEPAL